MSTQYSDIETALINKITTITEIKNVYRYRKGDLNGYPSCCLIGFNGNSQPRSALTVERTMVFTFEVLQEIERDSLGPAGGESIVNAIVDKLWDLFDNDYKLGCNVDNAYISRITKSWERSELYYRTIEFDITCEKLYTIT